jgi:transcriptional regulator with XRE-family HTH domain
MLRKSRPRRLHPRKAFGLTLRNLRLKRGVSQDALAHKTGYHRNYVGQLERGEKSPSLAAIFDFAEAFGMKPSSLLQSVERHVSGGKQQEL